MYLQTNKGDRKMSSATNTLSIHTKNKKINLSKSLMIKGLQCTKALWLKKYKKEVFTPPDAQILSVFETSNKVGEKACELFPNGKEVPYHNTSFEEKIALTQKWMDEGVENIYEATFQYNGILVMVDILHKTKDGWEIHEVKSSTWHSSKSVEDIGLYVYDAAIQYYVLTGCGLNITKTSIVLINSEYVRGETLDVEKLFSIVPVDEEVAIFQEDIPLHLHSFKSVLEDTDNEPDVDIGRHCKNPYWCAAMEYCWKVQKKIPDYSVFDIFAMTKNSKAMQLYHEGILKVEDIPDDFKLTDNQALTVNAWKTQKESIDKNEIQVFLDSIKYPIYHFDFETFQEAIPTIAGTKPYEQLPFQYSLHIEHKDGTLVHKEFLAKHIGDPREELLKQLITDIPKDATLMAFNASFEKMVLKNLIKAFPKYQTHIDGLIENIIDLATPFKNKSYYLPQMKGKYSIKIVLPLLVPEMKKAYKDLTLVSNGADAMNTFPKLKDMPSEERELYRKALLDYCELDTLAMVKILAKLRDEVISECL